MDQEFFDEERRWIGSDQARIQFGQKMINLGQQSTQYLRNQGYNVELISRPLKSSSDPRYAYFNDYWVIRK
jgi:hypothetical protein